MRQSMKFSDDLYIEEAIELVSDMADFAKMHMHINIKDFFRDFINSGLAKEIYKLNPIYVVGKSSIENVKLIYERLNIKSKIYDEDKIFNPSKEAWIGLVIASYVFAKNISFDELLDIIDIDLISEMFSPLHEGPHEKTIDAIDTYIKSKDTRLADIRKKSGFSQSQLALLSGVNKRNIQLYEERKKDINKASFDTIIKLSKALRIEPNKLYECGNVGSERLVKVY